MRRVDLHPDIPLQESDEAMNRSTEKLAGLCLAWRLRGICMGILFLLFLLLPQPADAQSARYGAGWTAGMADVLKLNSDATAGDDLAPGYGFLVGLHVDRWLGSDRRIGLRYQGSYQQPQFDWAPGTRRVDVVSADLSLLVRILLPEDAPPALPYIAGGVGGIWYDLGTGPTTTFAPSDSFHDGRSQILPAGLLAIGVDIPTSVVLDRYPLGIRLEVGDHISFRSPLRSITTGSRHGAVHHLRFTIGLYSAFSY